jgi:hypothetical protein
MDIFVYFIQLAVFVGGLFKIYTDMQVRFRELEIRLTSVEKQDDEIYVKLDKMMEKLVDIEIALQNKMDR